MSGDRTKLPKWAQKEMAKLEHQNNLLRDSLQQARDNHRMALGEEPSRIQVAPYFGERKVYLPDYETIRYMFDEGKAHIDVRVSSEEPGADVLLLSGNDTVRVLPRAANTIYVEVKR